MSNEFTRMAQQCRDDSKLWFPKQVDDLPFLALALGGEVGELQNLVKKIARGSLELEDVRGQVAEEAVDVLIYDMNIFAFLGVDPKALYDIKRARNAGRFGNGRVPA